MAGTGHTDYSATPLPKKLGIKEGSRVLLSGRPSELDLDPLPAGAVLRSRGPGPHDVVVLFTTRRADLLRRFGKLAEALDAAGRLWVAWPKKTSGVRTDLSFEIVQRLGLDAGLVDNKSASIDQTYQGLQFVYRLKDRRTA
jgi:hypothetical protein